VDGGKISFTVGSCPSTSRLPFCFRWSFVSHLVLMDTHVLVQGSVTNMHVVDW